MAILKQIKFGEVAHDIAKTVLTSKEGGVMSVTAPNGVTNGDDEQANYQYELDVNVDDSTIVKSGNKLAVGNVPAAQVSVADEAGVFTAENVETALKELKDDIAKVDGNAKSYKIVKVTESLGENVKEQYKLQETVGKESNFVGEPINIYKDSSLKSVALDGQTLNFTYILADGKESTVGVDVSTFLAESEFADGLQVTNHIVSVKIDPTSEKFLTVGKDGVKLDGVQDAIDEKVAALDVTDAAVDGQYVSQVSETDGKIAVSRLNVSDAVLNGYAKGEKPTSTAIADTDDVKGALAKLEHQVDAAKAAATTKVVEGTDAGNNLSIVTGNNADGSTTYTINLTDVASKAALGAEIAARKAVDGQSGDTYGANVATNYISDAKSLNDADVKLDAALKAEADRAKSAETSIDAAIGLTKGGDNETRTYANAGEYIGKGESNTVANDIKALDTQLKKVTDDLTKVQYKVNGTTLEFYGMTEHA